MFGGDYDHVQSFNENGWAIVEKEGLQGLVDTNGKEVLPMKYESIWSDLTEDGFICGFYPSKEPTSLADGKKDYFLSGMNKIKEEVKYLQSAKYTNLILFSNMKGKIGFLDRNGNISIPAIYSKAKMFNEGLTWVRK